MKVFYRRKLPHIQYPGDSFFVTFRLYGSIPKSELHRIKLEYENDIISYSKIKDGKEKNHKVYERRKIYILEVDQLLDEIGDSPIYLSDTEVSNVVAEAMHHLDHKYYNLIAFTIMSNHVHILFDTSIQMENLDYNEKRIEKEYVNVDQIMKLIKGRSARYANLHLNRSEQFWSNDNFDIFIRNERMMKNVIKYILYNPVKVGLVKDPKDYFGNYYFEWDKS